MILEFKGSLEKQKQLPEYFQNKVRFETKLIVSEACDAEDEFIENAIIFIEENLDNSDFSLSSLMDQFHMSQSSLYKKIKTRTGLSPTGFIRSVRLKNAARIILEKKSHKLSNLAVDVGFNDYRYFKKSFKKHFGCLPSEYKSLVLSNLYNRLISTFKKQSYNEFSKDEYYNVSPVQL